MGPTLTSCKGLGRLHYHASAWLKRRYLTNVMIPMPDAPMGRHEVASGHGNKRQQREYLVGPGGGCEASDSG